MYTRLCGAVSLTFHTRKVCVSLSATLNWSQGSHPTGLTTPADTPQATCAILRDDSKQEILEKKVEK